MDLSGGFERWLPAATWLTYAVTAYVLWTVYHRVRYGRSPVVQRFPPRRLYEWMDFGLGVCLVAYSAWIVLGPGTRPISVWGGAAVWMAGFALRVWAVVTLGPHWRMGQDESDTTTEFVARGPYRFMHHPINTALVVVAIGQALMTGLDWRAMFLLAFSVVYLLVQARAEERYWEKRRREKGEGGRGVEG